MIEWLLTLLKKKTVDSRAARVIDEFDCIRNNVKDGNFKACEKCFWTYQTRNEVLELKLENYLMVQNLGPPPKIEDQPEPRYINFYRE